MLMLIVNFCECLSWRNIFVFEIVVAYKHCMCLLMCNQCLHVRHLMMLLIINCGEECCVILWFVNGTDSQSVPLTNSLSETTQA